MMSMKSFAICLILALAPIPSFASDLLSGGSQPQDTAFETDSWVDAWVELWNTYDLEGIEELFVTDDRLTYLSSEKEGVIIGIDAVREHHRSFGFVPGGAKKKAKLWVDDLHTTDFGSSAVVTGVWFSKNAEGTVQRGPMTLVYVAEDGGFRLAHLHFANYEDDESN
jgi:hypothetical protein